MPLIEEIANSSSTSAPGWAYVPDTGYDPSKAPIQPSGARKRNARVAGFSGADASARKNNAMIKRLGDLDKDNLRDVQILIPSKQKDSGARAKGKTAATRKILLAARTFTNYLDEEESRAASESQTPAMPKLKTAASQRPSSRHSTAPPITASTAAPNQDTTSVLTLQGSTGTLGLGFGGVDDSKLLSSVVPSAPSAALLEALISAPPLSYNASRAQPSSFGKPQRHFCELCGYWGTIKCVHCGARVCGLSCKRAHDEDRCQKYPG